MHRHRIASLVLAGIFYLLAGPALAGSLFLAFTPDPLRRTGVSPEGCYLEPGEPRGSLAPPAEGTICHSGRFGPASFGIFAGDTGLDVPPSAEFTSPPLAGALELGGATQIRIHYIDEPLTAGCADPCLADLAYEIDELPAGGGEVAIAEGIAINELIGGDRTDECCQGQTGTFSIGSHRVAAGSRLRVRLKLHATSLFDGGVSNGTLLFGGDSLTGAGSPLAGGFGDSGITFTVGESPFGSGSTGAVGGALPFALMIPLLAAALLRQRRRWHQPLVRANSFM